MDYCNISCATCGFKTTKPTYLDTSYVTNVFSVFPGKLSMSQRCLHLFSIAIGHKVLQTNETCE